MEEGKSMQDLAALDELDFTVWRTMDAEARKALGEPDLEVDGTVPPAVVPAGWVPPQISPAGQRVARMSMQAASAEAGE